MQRILARYLHAQPQGISAMNLEAKNLQLGEAQIRALVHFHFSLKDSGFLFYGKTEMLPTNINLFTAVDHQQHVFTKVPGAHLDRHLLPRTFLKQERG